MSGRIYLENVILKHDVPVRTKYGTTHVYVFYNPKDNTTWIWKTSTMANFQEHCTYTITGRDEGDYYLSHVQWISLDRSTEGEAIESEQPDAPRDAWDIIFKKEVD